MTLILRWSHLLLVAAAALGSAAAAHAQEPSPDLPAAATPVALPAAATPAEDEFAYLNMTGAGRVTAARNSTFAVDPNGGRSTDGSQISSRLSLLGDFDTGHHLGNWGIQAGVGVDALSGTFLGTPAIDGDYLPGSRFDAVLLTQAWAGLSLRDLGTLRVGLMTSHWGLGLLANDGNHALDSRRDDWFVLPTTGDRIARAQLVLQPFGRGHSAARGLFLALSVDDVIEDATANRAAGDNAIQEVAALRWHFAKERWAGVNFVHRDQTYHDANGPFLKVNVVDAAFDMDYRKADNGLRVQGEAAVILGTTNLAPTPEHTQHDVRQAAAVLKARYDVAGRRPVRFELDGGWFSGDDNLADGALTGFKANPNFQQGILLFPQVLGWQSGRARITASNPGVTGYPSADLDRLATHGQVTSAITVFPKVGWKFFHHGDRSVEIYGGALLAWSPTPPIDAFSTQVVGGGAPRNYLGKAPNGSLLGTEFDAGLVLTRAPQDWPVALALRLECAVLVPGGVLAGMEGDSPIVGERLTFAILPLASKEHK